MEKQSVMNCIRRGVGPNGGILPDIICSKRIRKRVATGARQNLDKNK